MHGDASGGVELVGEHDVASAKQPCGPRGGNQAVSRPSGRRSSRATFIDSSIAAALVRCARELVRERRAVAIQVTEGSAPAVVIEIVGLASRPGIAVETVPASAAASPGSLCSAERIRLRRN